MVTRSPNHSVEHRLVDHENQLGWRVAVEQDLSLQPPAHQLRNLVGREQAAGPQNRSGVLLGLEQARHEQRLV